MNPAFIRIGDRVFNLSLVTEVILDIQRLDEKPCVWVGMQDSSSLEFVDEEAEALRAFFNDPNRVRSLTPSEEEESFHSYCDRGGELGYESWGIKYRKCNELNALSNPSDRQIELTSKLEQELLY